MEWDGRFRMRRDAPWLACHAWQYNDRNEIARVFLMTTRFCRVFPVVARDTYLHGQGRMVGRVFDRVTVVDGRGPELDAGELVTWLNDAVMIAPTMLLGPGITWATVDADAFDVSLVDRGLRVTARVTVDAGGRPQDFVTHDRFRHEPSRAGSPWARDRWSTPIEAWQAAGDRWLPTLGRAVWHTADGPFVYAEFRPLPGTLRLDVSPPD
jgi:hypothetical protein